MKFDLKFFLNGLFLALTLFLFPQTHAGEADAYFPTGDVRDGRMLSAGCPVLDILEVSTHVIIAVPQNEPNFTLSIFDGDTGSRDTATDSEHWDQGDRQLRYRLYFDPTGVGSTAPEDLVADWRGNTANPLSNPDPDPEKAWLVSSPTMRDNRWWRASIHNSVLAQSSGGFRVYHLLVEADGACEPGEEMASSFKLAVGAPATFELSTFGIEGTLRTGDADARILYPEWPPRGPDFFFRTPTTYDGSFEIFLEVETPQGDLNIFDGDFDIGTDTLSTSPSGMGMLPCADFDDPETPPDYGDFPPGFPLQGAAPEGLAGNGLPPEDSPFDIYRRGNPRSRHGMGCASYEVVDPSGIVYTNSNPSGSREWERFRIASPAAANPNNADYGPTVSADGKTFVNSEILPAGIWTLRLSGLDLANTTFWVVDGACAVRSGQPACNPPIGVTEGTKPPAKPSGDR